MTIACVFCDSWTMNVCTPQSIHLNNLHFVQRSMNLEGSDVQRFILDFTSPTSGVRTRSSLPTTDDVFCACNGKQCTVVACMLLLPCMLRSCHVTSYVVGNVVFFVMQLRLGCYVLCCMLHVSCLESHVVNCTPSMLWVVSPDVYVWELGPQYIIAAKDNL